ncbi:ABC transporter permease [Candidatus Nitrosacidococcus sp. I8]|uniref:ABC transporter permease n=1 Tax=Candidatus Nitrosacidococcus sp. I8 TaxID=2942908 RepID=UPI002225D8D0|nr:ABC transporter permease [Candidatus Nitrosacidococcus sp. I8]CAH9017709.1 Teichoic acid translocation permease protein TagG [Candidatus Nitrosacidococcus sp. I8]
MFLITPFKQFIKNRELILQLIWSEIAGRYRGSFAGFLWSLLNPLFSLIMYTFVFGVVFKARQGLAVETTFDFSLMLFTGLTLHGLLTECITRAPFLITGNPSYVKQVVFPLEILPLVTLGASLFHTSISFLLLISAWAMTHGGIGISIIYIPFFIAPLSLITLGLGWLIAATAVYFKDINQLVNFMSSGLLFFSPIFYPASAVPQPFQTILNINPLTYIIEQVRSCLLDKDSFVLQGYLVYLLIASLIAVLGYFWFQKVRPGFADIL